MTAKIDMFLNREQKLNSLVDIGLPMTERVLSTKVTDEEVELIKSIAEEKGTTVSAFLRELIDAELTERRVDWTAPCFGTKPREDKPKKPMVSIDEILYGK